MLSIKQNDQPNYAGYYQSNEYRSRGHVLGLAGELVVLGADSVNGRLNSGVEEFGEKYEKQHADQQRAFDAAFPQPECDRAHHQDNEHFLPDGNLAAKGIPETGKGKLGRP